jgi:RimJ/RimL family protein N-acetyltransferase
MEVEFEKWLTVTDHVHFGIEADGELIGRGGLYQIDHFSGRAALGIGLGRAFWGQGYGQDAVHTLVEYGFRHLNLQRIWLEVLADDARAVGAYQKTGFVEEGRLRKHAWFYGQHVDSLIMGLLRSEWAGNN